MGARFTVKQNDRLPALTLTARDAVGPVDLSGATAVFRLVSVLNGNVKITGAAAITADPVFTASGATLSSNAHGVAEGQDFTLKTTGTLPGNLVASKQYFAVNVTANTLQAALTKGGTPITTSSAGSGTHTLLLGLGTYEWANADTDTPGTYQAQIETTIGGKRLTFSNDENILIEITTDLAGGGDRVVAIKAVLDRVQADAAPKMSQGEVELEVDRAVCASVWAPNTFYPVGVEVVPPVRNGLAYLSCNPGTSGGSVSQSDWPRFFGESFLDGQSDTVLEWECIGSDRYNSGVAGAETILYDISRAARQCWLIKARRASQMMDDDDLRFSQVYDHCVDHANSFQPFTRPARLMRVYG